MGQRIVLEQAGVASEATLAVGHEGLRIEILMARSSPAVLFVPEARCDDAKATRGRASHLVVLQLPHW